MEVLKGLSDVLAELVAYWVFDSNADKRCQELDGHHLKLDETLPESWT